jgi:ribosome-binding factor A
MVDQARARRLAVRIREIVATTIESRIKDPRLGMVTITDVKLTGDLHDATVFYTVYGDEAEREGSAAALTSATGVLRSEVGRQTGVRFTPTLVFQPDVIPDTAKNIDELLARARAADDEVRRASVGAQPAGDPDPYRTTEPDDDSDGDSDE